MSPTTPGYFGEWGCVFSNAGDRYGTASGDCYYLAVSSEGRLLIGLQINNVTKITWYSATIAPL